MRFASYNIHRAIGKDRRKDSARISAVIGELKADVIGLQEVDWHHDHDDGTSQFDYLAHLPGYLAFAGPNLRDHRGHYGNLLLSRLPMRQARRVDLSEANREPRGAIDVDLDAGGACLRLIVTHLGLGARERWRQAARLGSAVRRRGQPTLLLGDFNEWIPGSPTLHPLLKLCMATAVPATYPSFRPFLALDRILACGFSSPPPVRTHASPLARQASDHLPVVSEFRGSATADIGSCWPTAEPRPETANSGADTE